MDKHPNPKVAYPAAVVLVLVLIGGAYALGRTSLKDSASTVAVVTPTPSATITAATTPTPSPAATTTATTSPVASPSASATPSPSAVAITACSTDKLKLSLTDNGGGTAGTHYYNAVVTNTSTSACTLEGYPTVSLVDKNQHILGTAEKNEAATSVSLVKLAPGAAAYAAVGVPNFQNFADPNMCAAASSSVLSLTPPGSSTALTVANASIYCPGFSVSAFSAKKL